MASYPSSNDAEFNLYMKIAYNWYTYLVESGTTGLTPPSWNDTKHALLSKTAYYTALAAS